MTSEEEQQAIRVFDAWEQELLNSGGPYLAGKLSLADLAFVPTVLRLTTHARDLGRWPTVQAWVSRLLDRASVSAWMSEARALPEVVLDDYLP